MTPRARGATPRPLPSDYDTDPGRFAANEQTAASWSARGDVHTPVADALAAGLPAGDGRAAVIPVLDMGAGTGHLGRLLIERGVRTISMDPAAHVRSAPPPRVRGEATTLPFASATFGAVAALWMLYHLADPAAALREARRVLRPGGTFVACASRRDNDPELATVIPGWGSPTTFDAEDAVEVVGAVFEVVAATTWDEPMVTLPDHDAVATCLRGRGLTVAQARRVAAHHDVPLTITKRGTLVWARA